MALALVLPTAAPFAHAQTERPLQGAAYRAASQAYRAFDSGNYADAVRYAEEAVRLRPDLERLRSLLTRAEAARDFAARPVTPEAPVASPTAPPAAVQPALAPQVVRPVAGAPAVSPAPRQRAPRPTPAVVARPSPGASPVTALPAPPPQAQPQPPTPESRLAGWIERIDRLQQAGEREAALALAGDALRAEGDLLALLQRRDALRRELAAVPAERMYRALAAGDDAAAARDATAALRWLPDDAPIALLRVAALLRTNDPTARAAADDAVARHPMLAEPWLLRAFARQQAGDRAGAAADHRAALAMAAGQGARLAVADAALAAGDGALASEALRGLRAGEPSVALRERLAELQRAQPDAVRPLARVPQLACAPAAGGTTACLVVPAADPLAAIAQPAYDAAAVGDRPVALRLSRTLVALQPTEGRWRQLLVNTLAADGQAGAARNAAATALREGATAGIADTDVGYLATTAGADAEAARAFDRAAAGGTLPAPALRDAAFAHQRAGDPLPAAAYLRRSIDAADDGSAPLAPQLRLDTRIAIASLERRWGASFGIDTRSGGASTLPGLGGGTASGRGTQAVGEVYYRPLATVGNGTYVDVYARALGNLSSGSGAATGGRSAQGALGVRIKPFTGHNAVFAAERLVAIGNASRDDWLLRAGYSAGWGTNLRADVTSWPTADLYAEAGRYTGSGENYFTSELRAGRSFRMPGLDVARAEAVLLPHAVLAADYSTAYAERRSVAAGLGLNARWWFRNDAYNAQRSSVDLSLQWRRAFSGDERAGGWVLRAGVNY